MLSKPNPIDIELIYIIVNYGSGSKLIHTAKQCGVTGGTILLGRGTVNSKFLGFLGLSDERKEIVLMIAEKETAYQALEKLNKKYELYKPNHGIVFTTSVIAAVGTARLKHEFDINEERGAEETMYHFITVIVDKGKAEDVIEAAVKVGSKGGTIINGRGSGIHETSKLFAMEIEPEKEIVLILSEAESTIAIVSSIRSELKIDAPGNGIIFIQDVNKTFGIYK
ncbi:MAG: P-II family nitrogen regulator [Syntrophomonas sp.]|nr:P-II family nitrogen regulator [Syntrophomonas sp.]